MSGAAPRLPHGALPLRPAARQPRREAPGGEAEGCRPLSPRRDLPPTQVLSFHMHLDATFERWLAAHGRSACDEIDETIFGNHDEACVFENPLVKLRGVCEVRSLFQLMKKSFWSFNIIRPVKVGLWLGGKDGEGAKLLLDFNVRHYSTQV